MDGKKDPGKFTVRFNIADPQQRAAAELLNQQGRYKAQFITNAVLFYTNAALSGRAFLLPDNLTPQYAKFDTPTKAKQNNPSASDGDAHLEDVDMDSIYRTMEAFHSK